MCLNIGLTPCVWSCRHFSKVVEGFEGSRGFLWFTSNEWSILLLLDLHHPKYQCRSQKLYYLSITLLTPQKPLKQLSSWNMILLSKHYSAPIQTQEGTSEQALSHLLSHFRILLSSSTLIFYFYLLFVWSLVNMKVRGLAPAQNPLNWVKSLTHITQNQVSRNVELFIILIGWYFQESDIEWFFSFHSDRQVINANNWMLSANTFE